MQIIKKKMIVSAIEMSEKNGIVSPDIGLGTRLSKEELKDNNFIPLFVIKKEK